jgi:hypothetical protein
MLITAKRGQDNFFFKSGSIVFLQHEMVYKHALISTLNINFKPVKI